MSKLAYVGNLKHILATSCEIRCMICESTNVSVYIITSRNNDSISNFWDGFEWQSEYPWCIIKFKFLRYISEMGNSNLTFKFQLSYKNYEEVLFTDNHSQHQIESMEADEQKEVVVLKYLRVLWANKGACDDTSIEGSDGGDWVLVGMITSERTANVPKPVNIAPGTEGPSTGTKNPLGIPVAFLIWIIFLSRLCHHSIDFIFFTCIRTKLSHCGWLMPKKRRRNDKKNPKH
ncbi:hypothetical protein AGLY_011061, partial [Aphis glycines]